MKRAIFLSCLLSFSMLLIAQDAPQAEHPHRGQGRGQWAGQGVAGNIVSITADGFTLKTLQGKTVTVKAGADTRVISEGQPQKFSDLKVGDMVMVRGQQAGQDVWKADAVVRGGGAFAARMREGMGKEFIAGEVKAINGLKLTIARVDGQTQTIEVNEETSFRKNRENITFPDIKVGDHVFGRGQLNAAGVFVPAVLNVGDPAMMGGVGGGGRMRQGPPPQPPQPPPQ